MYDAGTVDKCFAGQCEAMLFSGVLFGGPVAKVQGQPPRERGGSIPNVRVVLVLTVTNFTSILVYQISTLQRLRPLPSELGGLQIIIYSECEHYFYRLYILRCPR